MAALVVVVAAVIMAQRANRLSQCDAYDSIRVHTRESS